VEPWIDAVARVGVPTAIAFFVLVRVEGKVERLIDAIYGFREEVRSHLTRDDVKTIVESYLHLDRKRDKDDMGC
jgi:hypothetical protein